MSQYHKKPLIHTDHINLKVGDLEKVLAFYQTVFNFTVISQSTTKALLSADGLEPLVILEKLENPQPKSHKQAGLYHFALLLPNLKELSKMANHLLSLGISFNYRDHGITNALYFTDIECNEIEVVVDRPWPAAQYQLHQLSYNQLLNEACDEQWIKIPEGTVVGYIHLHVTDLKKNRIFYEEGIGLKIEINMGLALFLADGGYHHHVAINFMHQKVLRKNNQSLGLGYYTLVFPTVEKKMEVTNRLEDLGFEVENINGEFFALDPSGNKILLAT